MGKVKFEFSIEKITFKYEGDHDTGQLISQSMQRTLGSLAEAQNAVIDVTPHEEERQALPPAAAYTPPPKRRKHRRPRANSPAGSATDAHEDAPNGEPVDTATVRPRKTRSQGFRSLGYRLFEEGYFNSDRTGNDVKDRLSEMGFPLDPKNIASELAAFTKLQYLTRRKNEDGLWAYRKGPNNDYPRGHSGT